MNIRIILVLLLLSVSTAATAQCIGTDSMSSCTDDSGNTYDVTRYGNTTHVEGRARNGGSWSQDTTHIGNQTNTTGRASNGNTWDETRTEYGNGNYSVSGKNANGEYFSKNCSQFGCN